MSVREILNFKSNGDLSNDQRLQLKQIGPPRPFLNLKHTTSHRGKDINRYFHWSMYNLCDWICGCDVRNAFFCFPCLLFCKDYAWARDGVNDIKHLRDKIKSHTTSATHLSSCISFVALGRIDLKTRSDDAYRKSVNDHNDNVTKNRYIFNKLIDCVKFCGSFGLPLDELHERESSDKQAVLQGLLDFVSQLDTTFKDKNMAFNCVSRTVQNELLDSMLAVIHDQIKAEVEQADFVAIQVAEITDYNHQMVFIIRYVLKGAVRERFWKFIDPEAATAEEILKQLEDLRINEKLISQSYDGASVKSGRLGGVHLTIKQSYPNGNFIHSYAHQLNSIIQKAASQYKPIRVFFANLHAFASFFGQSPKRIAMLDRLVKLRSPSLAPKKWLFSSRCVETVHIYRRDLLGCLEDIIEVEEAIDTLNQAIGLRHHLLNPNFLFWLNYFYLIVPHADALLNQLQKPDLDAAFIDQTIAGFNSNIQNVKDSFDDVNLDLEKREIALEICDVILAEVHARFGFTDHLIASRLFHAEAFAEYQKKFPEDALGSVRSLSPVVDTAKLKTELQVIYNREDFRGDASAVTFLRVFSDFNLTDTFSESVKLLKILCTMPMVTAESERCFSTLSRIRTFLRNAKEQSRLSSVAMLSVERGFIAKIANFNELVIDHFGNQRDRGIDLIYKRA